MTDVNYAGPSARILKDRLWRTLDSLESGNIDINEARAMATLAKAIVNTANLQLKVSVHANRPMPDDVINFSEK